MSVTRYKPLFSVSVKYELASIGITSEGVKVEPIPLSNSVMNDLRLKSKTEKNTATVFYEGMETPADAPTQCEPLVPIDTEKFFYFQINLADKEKIKGLKFHSSAGVEKNIGFPVLYNASIAALNGPAVITAVEDVTFSPPLFSFSVKKSEAGSAVEYAALEITDEKNNPVDLNISPVKLSDKLATETEGDRKFIFSVDASSLAPGVYSFKVGNFIKKFFIPTAMDVSNAVSVIRVLKNNFLDYKKNLADNSFAKFELLIPKA